MKQPERIPSDPAGFRPVWAEFDDPMTACTGCELQTRQHAERCMMARCAAAHRREFVNVVFVRDEA
jgi:hypothetical protein